MLAASLGQEPSYPGNPVAISVMTPVWTEWWLRPESNAARDGEQSAVV